MAEPGTFPFGASLEACGATTPEPVDAFVLGAYPSGLHVQWTPPPDTGLRPVRALAVDNEPEVFWDGADAAARVKAWEAEQFDPAWGEIRPATLNGPSGRWLYEHVLDPMKAAGVDSHFITDCLTTYRLSTGAAARIDDTYRPFAETQPDLPPVSLPPHPTENKIVTETLASEATRLMRQLEAARPRLVLTLGNAAARVLAALAGSDQPGQLRAGKYGTAQDVLLGKHNVRWLAMVHPATPPKWQDRHREWLSDGGFARVF